MGINAEDFNRKVWPFYLKLENDFLNTLNYVSFSEENYKTHSIEFEREILSICSEFDVVCKLLCEIIDSTKSPKKINEYYMIISSNEDLSSLKINCDQLSSMEFSPFDKWDNENSPDWWNAYNKIKHDRIKNDNYRLGNLYNTYFALLGLYTMNRLLYRRIREGHLLNEPISKSQLFTITNWPIVYSLGNGFVKVLHPNGDMSLQYDYD